MAFGIGVLGFSSAAFWSMTLPEFNAAYDGYVLVHGSEDENMSMDDLEQMMRRFPDG